MMSACGIPHKMPAKKRPIMVEKAPALLTVEAGVGGPTVDTKLAPRTRGGNAPAISIPNGPPATQLNVSSAMAKEDRAFLWLLDACECS